MKNHYLTLLLIASAFLGTSTQAAVLTGVINDWAESSDMTFGDGSNDIIMTWSTASIFGGNGWFYGSDSGSAGYADFHIVSGGIDVTTVVDASSFSYVGGPPMIFNEGDTIFMRSAAGYYGALQVDEIYPNPMFDTFPYTFLNGSWFFQDNGTANFSAVVPIPGAAWLLASGLLTLFVRRRQTA